MIIAMKKCPYCMEDVEEEAVVCPHCQRDVRRWWWRHKILTVILIFIGSSFIVSFLGSLGGGSDKATSDKITSTERQRFVKVLSISGDQDQQSQEFVIKSKDVKFEYRCQDGPLVCSARLKQVGGDANKEIFHSSGSTGGTSGENIISAGPGRFYVLVNTGNRRYTIDVLESSTPASTEEKKVAEQKVSDVEPYRNIAGFELASENTFGRYQSFDYKTGDKQYIVSLNVNPETENPELEEVYSLERGSVTIKGVELAYGYQERSEKFDIRPYESVELVFMHLRKPHTVITRRLDRTSDKEGNLATSKTFVEALLSR